MNQEDRVEEQWGALQGGVPEGMNCRQSLGPMRTARKTGCGAQPTEAEVRTPQLLLSSGKQG